MAGGALGDVHDPARARRSQARTASTRRQRRALELVRHPSRLGWSAGAWGAIAVTVGFVAITCWWLAVDRSVQYGDAAQDFYVVLQFRDLLGAGSLIGIVDLPNYYPPGAFLLGAMATFVGGRNVGAAVIAQNLVYVPLLALSCYRTARFVASSQAGLLAVVFALGSPLIVEQFHVFMLDAPQAALVATSVWLVLESRRFGRVGVAALAGVALGVGVETKELAPLYLIGLVVAVLARGGGWRNWRGLLAFAGAAFVAGSPWYLRHADRLHALLSAAGPGHDVPPAASPALLSIDNALWYMWATLNSLLLAPLFAFAVLGVVLAAVRVVRSRPLEDPTFELLVGLASAWTVLWAMPHHDLRYTESLTIFLSVLGTAWIVRLPRAAKAVAIGCLVLAVASAHLGATFGVGGATERRLPGGRLATLGEGVPLRDEVVAYTNHNFLVGGPTRDGDVLHLFRALKAAGVKRLYWSDPVDISSPVFEPIGLLAFSVAARLKSQLQREDFSGLGQDAAVAIRELSLGSAPPCIVLADDTGVWVRRGDPGRPGARDFCPLRQPAVYGP